ncbi:long-chain-fatty-acid--CoA ligase [Parafrankia elaeagni]|uniref:long-chain-fatty-acid--CoA ligase n=1 Tax=Parafrankia elaeagni TaxID=222534 RepID=UPI000475CAC2|nr:long-chain fatty acid--CoA ligase [Parafrankia elaeagni]
MANLSQLLENTAVTCPDRCAVVLGASRLTYAEVDAAAGRVANLLVDRGIRPGDRIALTCANIPQFTVVYYGILKAGAVVVPLNVLLRRREIAYHLADSGARAYFCFEGTAELPMAKEAFAGFADTPACEHFFVITVDPAGKSPVAGTAARPVETLARALAERPSTFATVTRDDDDTAVILYTSGTTGRPKGAELRHRNMRDNALAGRDQFGSDISRPDTYLGALPLFHSFGQTVVQNGAFAFGGTVVLLPRFDAGAAIRLMLAERVTMFAGVPTMYWGLRNALGQDPSIDTAALARNLRVAVSGGSALPVEVHRQFEKQFGVTILEGYGLSETSPVASFSPYGQPPRVGSIGLPIRGVEMTLLERDTWDELADPAGIGEIAVRGHNVMKGYHRRPEETDEVIRDGWFRTGDLARRDEDGWYYIVDRSKDMITRGGYNVYPREIEEVLVTHPDVSLVAVIGVPHPRHGEEIKAVLIREPGATVTADELIGWAKEQMAAYKYPRIVEFVDTLPMTATGKILKRELS